MTPQETLGVAPGATLAEAEAAYRRLLLVHHPDKLVAADPDAIAEAEERTRELNRAIAALREADRVGVAMAGVGASRSEAPWAERARAEYADGRPLGLVCAICGHWFSNAKAFEVHAVLSHRVTIQRYRRRPLGLLDRLIQVPVIWSVAGTLLLVLWASLAYCTGSECQAEPPPSAQILAGVLFVWFVLLPLAYWRIVE